jgi:hypothetical protein
VGEQSPTIPKGGVKMAESQVEKIMRLLQCTQEEAEDVIKTDKLIDQGKPVDFGLTKEQEKEASKFTKVKRGPTAYTFQKRERKENTTKSGIIAELARFLEENGEISCENVQITNKERMISFHCGENDYEITLIQKRKPKN